MFQGAGDFARENTRDLLKSTRDCIAFHFRRISWHDASLRISRRHSHCPPRPP